MVDYRPLIRPYFLGVNVALGGERGGSPSHVVVKFEYQSSPINICVYIYILI